MTFKVAPTKLQSLAYSQWFVRPWTLRSPLLTLFTYAVLLDVPENLPCLTSTQVQSSREKRKAKAKGKKAADQEDATIVGKVASGSSRPFLFQGVGEHLLDTRKAPLMKWDQAGRSVTISTDLPSWKENEKAPPHAAAITTALFGRKNLQELGDLPPRELANMSAQMHLRGSVLNYVTTTALHRVGRENAKLRKELKEAKQKNKDAYSLSNERFRKTMFAYSRDSAEDCISRMKDMGAVANEFKDVDYSDVYPEVANIRYNLEELANEDVASSELGSDDGESGHNEEEGDHEASMSDDSFTSASSQGSHPSAKRKK